MTWIIWGIVLFLQNFSFTLVSRARNTNSLRFHAICSILSSATYILAQILLFGNLLSAFHSADTLRMWQVGFFYMIVTTVGSLTSHYIAMHWLEKWFKVH